MAFGAEPLGLMYFAGVKLAGYSAFGRHLRTSFKSPHPHAVIFGVSRTMLGLVAGVGFASLLSAVGIHHGVFVFYALLLPVRLMEWFLAIWFFFSRKASVPRAVVVKKAFAGSAVSYLLDIPAIASMFVIPGGAWIC